MSGVQNASVALEQEPQPDDSYVARSLQYVEPPSLNLCAYDWHCPTAERIVTCESGWNIHAVSWDGSSYGLFQINAIHFWRWPNAWNEWDNPEVNTRWAWELYQESGWGIWSCA